MAERVALITGVSGGIGRATAGAFAAAGWQTVGVDVEPGGEAAVDRFAIVDLADAAAVSAAAGEVSEREGRLDALVNNAARQVCKTLAETTLADWDAVMAVNLRAPFWLMHELLPLLRASRGAVVNVASVHAVATSPEILAYATSKGGMAAMTRAAALELAADGVRVNAVLPGAVDTPMLRAGFARRPDLDADAEMAAFAGLHPLGRVARPDEIAQAILYLADGERSSYVTGTSLVVDGGVTARLSTE